MVKKIIDKNYTSLACKRIYKQDNEQRQFMRGGCGLNPANQA
jgi:F-box/leucine-rich repeat protein 2/20